MYTIKSFQTHCKLCGSTFVHFNSCRSQNPSRNTDGSIHRQEGGVSYKLKVIVIDLDQNNLSLLNIGFASKIN